MQVILGSGINGMLVAQRLRAKGKEFVLLDKAGMNKSRNDQGFFYAHEPNPFTKPDSFPIISHVCPGGTEEGYARKAYGGLREGPPTSLSFAKYAKDKNVVGRGWDFDFDKLQEGLTVTLSNIISIRTELSLALSREGHAWDFSGGLISTIPLPVLLRYVQQQWSDTPLDFLPIYLTTEKAERRHAAELEVPAGSEELHVYYCASDCHSWYRASCFTSKFNPVLRYESIEAIDESSRRIMPGKIWHRDELNTQQIDSIRSSLKRTYNIYTFGRYGTWTPKQLTSDVWTLAGNL